MTDNCWSSATAGKGNIPWDVPLDVASGEAYPGNMWDSWLLLYKALGRSRKRQSPEKGLLNWDRKWGIKDCVFSLAKLKVSRAQFYVAPYEYIIRASGERELIKLGVYWMSQEQLIGANWINVLWKGMKIFNKMKFWSSFPTGVTRARKLPGFKKKLEKFINEIVILWYQWGMMCQT